MWSAPCRAWFCAHPRRRVLLLVLYVAHDLLWRRVLGTILRGLCHCRRCFGKGNGVELSAGWFCCDEAATASSFDQDDLETRAVAAYLRDKHAHRGDEAGSGGNEQDRVSFQRMHALLKLHAPSHREALARVLPGLWAWYPMGRLIYSATLVQQLSNKLALLDFEGAGGASGMGSCAAEIDGGRTCYHHYRKERLSKGLRGVNSDASDDDTHYESDALLQARLPPTVWVVGLPRTGSTFFHQLLDLDPSTRCLRQWELRSPVACSAAVRRGDAPDTRLAEARKGDAAFEFVFSELRGIHFIKSGQVDECVQGFVNAAVPEYYLWGCRDMPEAFEWYTSLANVAHHRAQYEHFRRLIAAVLLAGVPRALGGGGTGADGIYGDGELNLGSISGNIGSNKQDVKDRSNNNGRGLETKHGSAGNGRSMRGKLEYPDRADGNAFQCVALKSPHHSVKLTTIAEVFGARESSGRFVSSSNHSNSRPRQTRTVFVWLHRSLEAVVGSTCSMNAAVNACMTSLYEESPASLGRRTLDCLARSMDIAVHQRRELEADTRGGSAHVLFIDVFHEDLQKDPVTVVKTVYKKAGFEVSAEFEAALEQRASEERDKVAKRNHEAKQKQQSRGHQARHRYSLSEYGLTKSDVEKAFSLYNTLLRDIRQGRC